MHLKEKSFGLSFDNLKPLASIVGIRLKIGGHNLATTIRQKILHL
jgi:hypothetical protein